MVGYKFKKNHSKTLSLLMIFILTTTMFVFQSMSVNASDKVINIDNTQVKISTISPNKCIISDNSTSIIVQKVSNNRTEIINQTTGKKDYFIKTDKGIYSSITNDIISYKELYSQDTVARASKRIVTLRISYATIKKTLWRSCYRSYNCGYNSGNCGGSSIVRSCYRNYRCFI